MPIPIGKKFSYFNNLTGTTEICYVIDNNIDRGILTMHVIGSRSSFECNIREIGRVYKPFYESPKDTGIIEAIQPEDNVYYLTNIDKLELITVYNNKVDFSDKLRSINAAMLSMNQAAYVYIELQRHIETNDFYIEIHKWQAYQRLYGGLICDIMFYDQNEGVRKRDFTDHLSDYSMLRLYGYYVSGDLTDNDRYRILMNCIYYNLVSIDDVISHIDYLRTFAHTDRSRELWENDLKFVYNYYENLKLPRYSFLSNRKEKWKNDATDLKREFRAEYDF